MFYVVLSFWHYRSLALELFKRELTGRYKETFAGYLWFIVQPLYLLFVYSVVFGIFLKLRWGTSTSGTTSEYVLMLFSGLIIFNVFSECLVKSPTLITNNPSFVKKIVFPLELLPLITVCNAMTHALIGLAVWCLGYSVFISLPHPSIIFAPVILLCFLPFLYGLSLLLATLGIFLKDINYLTSIISHTFLFLTPIFYAYDTMPLFFQKILMLNPLTYIIEQLRLVLYYGHMPDWNTLGIYLIGTSLFTGGTLMLFQHLRKNFADMV
jgi:lipopolysaccharide transport system permease protein